VPIRPVSGWRGKAADSRIGGAGGPFTMALLRRRSSMGITRVGLAHSTHFRLTEFGLSSLLS
jgi:hypothetical protein